MPNIDHEGRKETDKLTLLKGGRNFLIKKFHFLIFCSLLIITTASINISGGQLLLNQKTYLSQKKREW